jgi:hypothetical protein
MPTYLFVPAIEKSGKGLAAIESLATKCKTSLHATAIRYTQLTSDLMAVIISNENKIEHCFMSESLKEIKGTSWIKRNSNLPTETATCEFNRDYDNILHCVRQEETSYFQQWFGGKKNTEIYEDIIGLGSYGKTLTVLYDIDLLAPEEEDEEYSMEQSWIARFKK